MGRRGAPVRRCTACQDRYHGWSSLTAASKLARLRAMPRPAVALRAKLFLASGNKKLGGIPCSITSSSSCPPTCSFYGQGCYAEYHVLRKHWRDVDRRGDPWEVFCSAVAHLPHGTLWRHNEAGDLPGHGRRIDARRLDALVRANRGRRGFTFTHKTAPENWQPIYEANRAGFTINLSADSLEEADRLKSTAAGPVAAVLPSDAPVRLRTPAGHRVVVCPAERYEGITCATCALCSKAWRQSIVGFRAHGQAAKLVTEIVRGKREA